MRGGEGNPHELLLANPEMSLYCPVLRLLVDQNKTNNKACMAGVYEQHLDNLRRKDPLRGAETNEISVRLGNYSTSHFEGPAFEPIFPQVLFP